MTSLNGFSRYLGGISQALSTRNYRVYWYGHLFSAHGVWIYMISSQWLMFHLTSSPAWLGAVGFAYLAPLFFLGPLAGAISDRYGHRKLGIMTLSLGVFMSHLTALTIVTKNLTPHLLLILTIIQGIFMSFDFPARQALIPQLIHRKNLSAAIGMNWTTFNVAAFLGPVIGGSILSFGNSTYGEPIGAAMSYTVVSLTYCCMILGIASVKLTNTLPVTKQATPLFSGVLKDLHAGISYIIDNNNLKIIMILSITVALCLRPYQNLMAGFAKDVLQLDERGLGNLLAASGIGALFIALIFAIRGKTEGLTKVYVYGALLTSSALLAFVSNSLVPLALVIVTMVGGLIVATDISAQTLIQNMVLDQYRARVISITLAVSVGASAFGSLAIGWLGEFVGLQFALGAAAVTAIIIFLLLGRNLLPHSSEIETEQETNIRQQKVL